MYLITKYVVPSFHLIFLANKFDKLIVLWLKYLFGPNFCSFVVDGPHFDRMFKMVRIFTEF